jgi:hypothetical protein
MRHSVFCVTDPRALVQTLGGLAECLHGEMEGYRVRTASNELTSTVENCN